MHLSNRRVAESKRVGSTFIIIILTVLLRAFHPLFVVLLPARLPVRPPTVPRYFTLYSGWMMHARPRFGPSGQRVVL